MAVGRVHLAVHELFAIFRAVCGLSTEMFNTRRLEDRYCRGLRSNDEPDYGPRIPHKHAGCLDKDTTKVQYHSISDKSTATLILTKRPPKQVLQRRLQRITTTAICLPIVDDPRTIIQQMLGRVGHCTLIMFCSSSRTKNKKKFYHSALAMLAHLRDAHPQVVTPHLYRPRLLRRNDETRRHSRVPIHAVKTLDPWNENEKHSKRGQQAGGGQRRRI